MLGKKVRGKFVFFGPWAEPEADEILVPHITRTATNVATEFHLHGESAMTAKSRPWLTRPGVRTLPKLDGLSAAR
jgi:hypothetical protein